MSGFDKHFVYTLLPFSFPIFASPTEAPEDKKRHVYTHRAVLPDSTGSVKDLHEWTRLYVFVSRHCLCFWLRTLKNC